MSFNMSQRQKWRKTPQQSKNQGNGNNFLYYVVFDKLSDSGSNSFNKWTWNFNYFDHNSFVEKNEETCWQVHTIVTNNLNAANIQK